MIQQSAAVTHTKGRGLGFTHVSALSCLAVWLKLLRSEVPGLCSSVLAQVDFEEG
jgi:hypothetical protein